MSTWNDSPRFVYLNGAIVPEAEAKISIFDSAVRSGDSITECTRTFAHQPSRLGDHVSQLYRSLKIARIDPGLAPDQLLNITHELLQQNLQHMRPEDDCWLVHCISRGLLPFGASSAQTNPATVMIYTAHLDLRDWAKFYWQGCHAVTATSRGIPAQALDARVKNCGSLAYSTADAEARLVDPDAQCVILDVEGYVAEGKDGNIFAVHGDQISTPTTENCADGIARQTMIEFARALKMPMIERRMQPYDLYSADEIFFAGTPYCIMPVTQFNGLPVGHGVVGSVTLRLLSHWSETVGVDIVKQATCQLTEHSSE